MTTYKRASASQTPTLLTTSSAAEILTDTMPTKLPTMEMTTMLIGEILNCQPPFVKQWTLELSLEIILNNVKIQMTF